MDRKPTPSLAQIAAALGTKDVSTAGVIGALVSAQVASKSVRVEKFETLLDLEAKVRGAQVDVGFAQIGLPDYQMAGLKRSLKAARLAQGEAVDALTPQEMAEYGPYRIRVMNEYK
jgi:hypothetical protein